MNFLEIINNCLLELNYKQVNALTELVKNDHKKLISILNIVNQEICNSNNWNFLLRKETLKIPKNTVEVKNPISGRILYLLIDNKKYLYQENIEPFLIENAPEGKYGIYNNKLLFGKFSKDKTAEIYYYTKNCAVSKTGEEKEEMTDSDDSPLIPMPFAKQLLTYGACLRLKANPSYIRFSYWMGMYKEALANLKSKTCIDSNDAPIVKLYRQ